MSAPVVIVGVGALGSHVALLARGWERPLKLVDFDRVEQKNTAAQLHTRMALGKNKAVALRELLLGLFGTRVEAVPHRLVADNAEVLLEDAALVIDCTDNAAARRAIQDEVRRSGIACLHGALSADGSFARAVWDEHFVTDEEPGGGAATCEDGRRLPFFVLAAAEIALVAQRFLETKQRQSVQITANSIIRLA